MNENSCDLPIEEWNWVFLVLVNGIVGAWLFTQINRKRDPEKVEKIGLYFTYAPLIFLVWLGIGFYIGFVAETACKDTAASVY